MTSNHARRHNRISGQFAARTIEMLESPAYRVLTRSAHLVISRLEIELAHHGGNDNGRLIVTTEDFMTYGMHRTSVAPAIREAEALGFIKVTERGRGGNAEFRSANRYFLTFAHGRDSKSSPPTDDWRRIKTIEEAERIAQAARADKNEAAVEFGKRSWRKRRTKQNTGQNTGTKLSRSSVRKQRTETSALPVRKIRTTSPDEETEPPSIARGGSRSAPPSAVASEPPHIARVLDQIMSVRNCDREQAARFFQSLPDSAAAANCGGAESSFGDSPAK